MSYNAGNPQVVVVNPKSMAVAYILWFLLGHFGAHKFYLGQVGMGVFYLCLGVVGWATSWLLIGFIPLGLLWLLMIIDIFLIPGRVQALNRRALGYYGQYR